jgi:PERQ amino acid-rich with GYF domain-containing protein
LQYSNFGPSSSVASTSYGNIQNSSQDNIFGEGASYQALNYHQYNALGGGHAPSLGQQYTNPPTTQYASPQISQQSALPSHTYEQQGHSQHTVSNESQPVDQFSSTKSAESLWENDVHPTRRPGPFEVAHPTSTNTAVVQPPTVDKSPWGQRSQSSSRAGSRVNDTSSWTVPAQDVTEDNWKESSGADRLTFSNVGKHNEHQQETANIVHIADVEVVPDQSQRPPELSELPPPPSDSTTKPVIGPSASSKPQTITKPAQHQLPKAAPPTPQVTPDPPPSAAPKPAWSKEDEAVKAKPSGVSISLREIQEAEAKKAEARKVAERERERAARGAAISAETKVDAQPFTASWGLPTSQAGARTTAPLAKDTKDTSPSPGSTNPVWTTSGKSPVSKKSMKEIQEEEERRKKTAAKETVATAAARRAYAESTTKVQMSCLS